VCDCVFVWGDAEGGKGGLIQTVWIKTGEQ